MEQLYTIFEVSYFAMQLLEKVWVTELRFYQNDISNTDLKTHQDFKCIKGERNEAILLGTASLTFPITYPLILDNGIIIQSDDYYKYHSPGFHAKKKPQKFEY